VALARLVGDAASSGDVGDLNQQAKLTGGGAPAKAGNVI